MEDLRTKTLCVRDFGNFLAIARRASEFFGKTYYFSPWERGGSTVSNELTIGFGLPGLSRVKKFWNALMHAGIDCYCFTDVGEGDLQEFLRSIGKRVWGSFSGEDIELYRPEAKKLFKRLGMPVGPYVVIV